MIFQSYHDTNQHGLCSKKKKTIKLAGLYICFLFFKVHVWYKFISHYSDFGAQKQKLKKAKGKGYGEKKLANNMQMNVQQVDQTIKTTDAIIDVASTVLEDRGLERKEAKYKEKDGTSPEEADTKHEESLSLSNDSDKHDNEMGENGQESTKESNGNILRIKDRETGNIVEVRQETFTQDIADHVANRRMTLVKDTNDTDDEQHEIQQHMGSLSQIEFSENHDNEATQGISMNELIKEMAENVGGGKMKEAVILYHIEFTTSKFLLLKREEGRRRRRRRIKKKKKGKKG
ncbi:hypothetical protein RFI_09400 [Reticulomyxa filosa]|uniref:Uncharacterized protein n=1 Tax=Reticulomyxa filosa TaxID=46433 RepID=X6NNY1_RETFI|nr:hypothetical protein RFI_09400 [Reticulomyxa filosa]|eukprot:ETO27731.1 hypothetical protein RFI_09400 [Reticulomyxa filosa]